MQTVSPTFAEAWHYANLSGQVMWTITGLILLCFAGGIILLMTKNIIEATKGVVAGLFLLIALGVASILAKPLAIHWSNDKQVPTEYLQKVGKKYILDSVYNSNRMINAAVK